VGEVHADLLQQAGMQTRDKGIPWYVVIYREVL
jgi:hypothetical protein